MHSSNEYVKDGVASPMQEDLQANKIRMKRELGLLEGVAVILGIIFGSGIFISPKGIIQEVDSIGFSLVVWVLCGLLSMIGAICYAELGTTVPKSGDSVSYYILSIPILSGFRQSMKK